MPDCKSYPVVDTLTVKVTGLHAEALMVHTALTLEMTHLCEG